ncbi:hypothetical protein MNEG_13441, partial [Monoraphidium neglectum]
SGLPLGRAPALDAACAAALPALVGRARWPAYRRAGFPADPELLYVYATDFDDFAVKKPKSELLPTKEVGDPTPVPAWVPDYNVTDAPGPPRRGVALETASVAVIRAQYAAFNWLREHVKEFPVIDKGP